MDIDYDELDKPRGRELVIMWFYRALPYIIGVVVLCITVAVACSIGAKMENKAASDPWLNSIRSYSRDLKTSVNGQ